MVGGSFIKSVITGTVAKETTEANRARGLAYVDGLRGHGGTMMIEGIKAALDFEPDPGRQRMIFFLTDGYIGNENQILAAIRERVGDTRLYALGVGSAPNRYLIDEMAAEGRSMKHANQCPGFSGIDSNGDGEISGDEFAAHQADHHKQMHKGQDQQ